MEKISAACAMEWSIELEKGLRSKKPGQSIKAIKSMGPRLHKWSMEPSITMAISDMYSLVPGEHRAFANTILLRLADAFKCGDNYTRSCILEIFLLELRHLRKKSKMYTGILAKQRVPNYVELLKRVKTVFDTGDAESKALSLRLFGCLSDLANDSPQIRYIILLSLRSSHVLEVKASLFAAGCLCLLSDDFACIILEILTDMISSLQTSLEVTSSAVRVFSKMRCSSSIASKAYKAGKKLMMGSLKEEFKAEMLSSLSILVFRSKLLYIEQVDLLLSCLSGKHTSTVKARALTCLYILLPGGGCLFPVKRSVLDKFFHILDDNDLPVNLQCEALLILCKIFRSMPADLPDMDMPDLFKLVRIVKKAAESSIEEKRFLSLRLLEGILYTLKMQKMPPLMLSGSCPALVVAYATSFTIDHIHSLVKQKINTENFTSSGIHSTLKQKCKSVLSLVLRLAEGYPSSVLAVIDGVRRLIESLLRIYENFNRQASVLPQMEIVSELVSQICSFVNACLDILDKAEFIVELYQKVKLLLELIEQSDSCDCYAYEIFYLRMHSSIARVDVKLGLLHDDCWVCDEWRILEFTKKMARKRNNWAAYRAGKYACCRGLWFAATFTFRKLIDTVESDSCHRWLRSLMLLSAGESEIKLLIFPKAGTELVDGFQTENDSGKPFSHLVDIDTDLGDYEGKLARIYSRICSCGEILAAGGASGGVFYFQRWFLSLRAKVLEALIDFLGMLGTRNLDSLLSSSSSIGLRWNRLAKEYDLLATSFPDIDAESFRSISALALNCSLLSFCTTFALYSAKPPACESSSKKFLPCGVVRDLAERLSDIDEEVAGELRQFMAALGGVMDSYQSRTHVSSAGYMEKDSLSVSKFSIRGVLRMQEEAIGSGHGEVSVLMRGLRLLFDIARKWMGIPFRTPKCFFRVRPCTGAEVFIFNGDSKNKHKVSCSSGSQLSLNLCLQIKNASMKPYAAVSKVYCILAARPSDNSSSWGFHPRNTDEMVNLAELLLTHMRTETKGTSSDDLATAYISLELNEKGQGFSSCVLGVSTFPHGSYLIKWHSCCFLDNGSLWSLMPLSSGCIFDINKS